MRDGFIFYSSFYEALAQLDDADRLAAFDMISKYALIGELPEGASGAGYAIFLMAKPQIDANESRRINGTKGGRPKTEEKPNDNQTITEAEPNDNQTITEPEPKEKEKREKEKEKGKAKEKAKALAFGEYGNVRMSASEYDKLVADFGQVDTDEAVKYLDEYIAEKGYKSKSHYLAMRRWVFEAVKERKQKPAAPPGRKANKFVNFDRNRDNDALMAQIIGRAEGRIV